MSSGMTVTSRRSPEPILVAPADTVFLSAYFKKSIRDLRLTVKAGG